MSARKQPNQNQTAEGRMAVIYARYSSQNQRDVSIDQQVEACRKYAAAHDIEVIRVYHDHAMTGTNDNRPAFRQMIHDSASRAFSYVIVYTLDRFSRDRYDSAVHKHTLKEHGVKVLSAMENIDEGPMGVLMESVLEGFAEYYSKELAQKVKRGIMDNVSKCYTVGRVPLGYRRGADGRYEIVPEEADLVREIYARFRAGEELASISRDLNSRGLTTKGGSVWSRSSYRILLHDERYIGVYSHCGTRVEGAVPAILGKALFDEVQVMCKNKPRPENSPRKRRRESGTYLLTGKLYCGECKSPMVGISGTSHMGNLHFYYVCKGRREHRETCRMKNISRDRVELMVAEQLRLMISRPEVAAWMADTVMEYLRTEGRPDHVTILENRLKAIRKEKENTLKAIRMGVIASSVQEMLAQIEDEEKTVAAQLAIAQEESKIPFTRAHVIAWFESFASGDIEDKAYQEKLIDHFLIRAYLYPDGLKLIVNHSGRGDTEIDVPFNIDTVEATASSTLEIAAEVAEEVRTSGEKLRITHLIRTTQIYLVCGVFVLVSHQHRQK